METITIIGGFSTVICQVSEGGGPYEYTWRRNGRYARRKVSAAHEDRCEAVRPGSYTCTVRQGGQSVVSKAIYMQLLTIKRAALT